MNDDDRIAYLSGDDVALPDDERADLDELRQLLGDPTLWARPSDDLEDRVVAAITAEAAHRHAPAPPARASVRTARRPRSVRALAAAAVLVVAVGVTAALLARRSPGGEHFALALASPAGAAQPITATADLRQTTSGWRITLDAPDLPRLDNGRFYQAWLRNAGGVLVPIGTFNEGAHVVLWAGVSPREFATMTITEENADGNQASSGVRVLAGTVDAVD